MIARSSRALAALLLLPAVLALPGCNETVVGTGTAASCTEAALSAALAAGGIITFNCGAAPITITVTSPKSIAVDTAIDGDGLVTLSGGGTTQIFVVNSGVIFGLANLTISNANGAISSRGSVMVTNSTFSANGYTLGNGALGGAIYSWGPLTISNSSFSNNSADQGGAIFSASNLTVNNCSFVRNRAIYGGAMYRAGGIGTVSNSIFSGNSAARVGGAIRNAGWLTVTNSVFDGNSNTDPAGGWAGAIYNIDSRLTIANSTFVGNATSYVGGAIQNSYGDLIIDRSTFRNNSAPYGGAILDDLGMAITNSTFAGNQATKGGAILVDAPAGTVFNTTFSGNSATSGATIYLERSAMLGLTLINCTVSGSVGASAVHDVTLLNTIVTGTSGANCSGFITDRGHNIDSGTSCGFTSAKGSMSNTDPSLDPVGLADNGGAMQTIALLFFSPAINAGDQASCAWVTKNLDQRGFVRPGSGATNCSIGAFEFASPGPPCVGDCSRDRQVTVDGILTMVTLALANDPITACEAGDGNHDGRVTVDEILAAVGNALNGCPSP